MDHQTTKHGTSTLRRTFKAPVARLFAAFADPEARVHWATPADDISLRYTQANFSVGGLDVAECGGAFEFTLTSRYLDIQPEARIVMVEEMATETEGLLGASLISLEMMAAGDGSELVVTTQTAGLDGSGLEAEVTGGWSAAFDRLDLYLARSGEAPASSNLASAS